MELLNTVTAAAVLGMRPGTLRLWRHKGVGPPFVKIHSALVRYRVQDLEAWVASQVVEPGKPGAKNAQVKGG